MEMSEETKIRLLLIPRYRIIQKYPNPIGKVGDIIHFSSLTEYHDTKAYDDYPKIFHKLQWWELRQPDEMPEYIKYFNYNIWYVEKLIFHGSLEEPYPYFTSSRHKIVYYSNVEPQPATKEEYDQYQSITPLLIPRYKVIKDYPTSKFHVGQTLHNPPAHLKLDDYPEFFQKLNWWDERNPEEMPLFIKQISPNFVFKVIKYHKKWKKRVYLESPIQKDLFNGWRELDNNFIPATEKDFTDQPVH